MTKECLPIFTEAIHGRLLRRTLFIAFPLLTIMFLMLARSAQGQVSNSAQIEILNVPPDVNSPPIPTEPANQLLDLDSQKRWSAAANLGQKLAQQYPREPMIFYGLGVARIHLREPIGAVQALRTAQRLGLKTFDLHVALGIAYIFMNQYVLFEQQMSKAIQLNPTSYVPRYYMGRYLESIRGDFAGALEYFDKATRLDPEDARSWYYRGYCLQALGRPIEAQDAYETAIRLVKQKDERLSLPYQGMARLLVEAEPAQALPYAQKAVALEPKLDSNHLTMAKVYERLGKLSEAVGELKDAIRCNPSNAASRYVLSRIYTRLGDRKAAQAQLGMFEKISRTYGPQ